MSMFSAPYLQYYPIFVGSQVGCSPLEYGPANAGELSCSGSGHLRPSSIDQKWHNRKMGDGAQKKSLAESSGYMTLSRDRLAICAGINTV